MITCNIHVLVWIYAFNINMYSNILKKGKEEKPTLNLHFLSAVAATRKVEEILDISAPVSFHEPYASSSFDNSDEIWIAIQHQDLYILPSKSSLHIL